MSRLDAIEARAEAAVKHDRMVAGCLSPYARDVPDLVGLVRTLGEALREATLDQRAHRGSAAKCSVCAALALYDEWGSP